MDTWDSADKFFAIVRIACIDAGYDLDELAAAWSTFLVVAKAT
jgi:hypothetical protein